MDAKYSTFLAVPVALPFGGEEVPRMEFQRLSLSGALGRCVLQRPAAVTLSWL